MKKQHSKLLKLNKKAISNFSIYAGAPPPRDTEYSSYMIPEEEHPNTTSTYAVTHKVSCY